ncbi:PREDICTED: uncharacterized protein LOC104811963 [Tarenaya hassleriana]|uniref:uncharacterized protein LOC104811963 n=1 Tax=Tarenaya hassleriana TaxID=28532 RepID=UPI00053C72C4|nr:PREDICTED: uncharacterized protein LOC104811963 [Tarenaya hassleriana]XP_010537162.1 PREDICTED: uncharacterized protein LOC104811963 [Tarenaya hassleriana]
MMSTDGVELTRTINASLPWKMVAKGSRSSTRRNKKPVSRVAALGVEAAGSVVEGVSESEKLGVAVLGQHFAEKVEHVPIKKRRFIVRSPSPSNKSSSRREGLERCAQINQALRVARLNPNLIYGRRSEVFSEKPDCNSHDFSGIEILADVACSSDISTARDDPFVEEPAEQGNPSILSVHVEGDASSDATVTIFQEDTVHESRDQAAEDKSEIVMPQRSSVDVLDHDSVDVHRGEQSRVLSGEMVYQNNSVAVSNESSTERQEENEADESEKLAPQNHTVGVSEKTATDQRAEKSKDGRLYWDLNLSMDAWGQPCDAEGEVTETVSPMETEPTNSSKGHVGAVISSDGHLNIPSSPFGSNAEAAAKNDESQSGCDSQFEDGELREPYPCWEENEGDAGEVEQVDYGSEPEGERFDLLGEVDESKLDGVDKRIVTGTNSRPVNSESRDPPRTIETNEGSDVEKHVVVCLNDSHVKGGSSPFGRFSSKPFKGLPSHDKIWRRRYDNYEDSNERDNGSDKFVGRFRSGMHMKCRSPGRGHFSRWDSRRRLSPTYYEGSSYSFGNPRPKSMVEGRDLMNAFDQPGPGPGPEGYVRRQVSGGVYRGRQFQRRLPDGGDRDLRGVVRGFPNEYSGRVNRRIVGSKRERSNSPVYRRLHYPQPYGRSWSISRSRSPVSSWNNRNRSPPGFRADDRMPFQRRFPSDHQETGFLSPQRNRMSPPPPRNSRFFEGRGNDQGNNIRERRSPGRMRRLDNGGTSMRREHHHHHLRPMMRQKRLEEEGQRRRRDSNNVTQRQLTVTSDGSGLTENKSLRLWSSQTQTATGRHES